MKTIIFLEKFIFPCISAIIPLSISAFVLLSAWKHRASMKTALKRCAPLLVFTMIVPLAALPKCNSEDLACVLQTFSLALLCLSRLQRVDLPLLCCSLALVFLGLSGVLFDWHYLALAMPFVALALSASDLLRSFFPTRGVAAVSPAMMVRSQLMGMHYISLLFLASISLIPMKITATLLSLALYAFHCAMHAKGEALLFPHSWTTRLEESVTRNMSPELMCGSWGDNSSDAIFARLLSVFEEEKPYLDPDLTIKKMALRLYTNKLYLSRSIKYNAKMHFCRFVNSYRVNYAVAEFRKNPSLRVNQLAAMSGFKTAGTFTSAFRLEMEESPTEWCKYYRSTIKK